MAVAPPAPVALGFNATTRRLRRRQNVVPFSENASQQIELPQVGFLAGIWLRLSGTTTTAVASSTIAEDYPKGAFNIMRRVRVSTNEGADFLNVSGQGLYLLNRVLRTGFDPFTDHADQNIAGVGNPFDRYWSNPVSLGASQTDNWVSTLYLPLAWTMANLQGLLLAQNLGVRFTLTIDWGNTASLYSATTGTVTLSNVVALPVLDMFAIPDDEINYPDLRFAHTWIEELTPLETTDFQYRAKLGNIYLRSIQEFVNPVGGNFLPVSPADILERRFSYAQTQNVEFTPTDVDLFMNRFNYSADLPPGVYTNEWQNGNGVLELGNTRDAVDSSLITDMTIETRLSSGLTLNSGSFVRTINEQLMETRG